MTSNHHPLKHYLSAIFQDIDGMPSSKRIITAFFSILLGVGFLANLFWKYQPSDFVFNAVAYIVMAGLGVTGAEKFAPRHNQSDTESSNK